MYAPVIDAIPKNLSEQKAYKKQITNANIPVPSLMRIFVYKPAEANSYYKSDSYGKYEKSGALRSVMPIFPPPLIPVIILSAMIPSTSSIIAALSTVVPTCVFSFRALEASLR